MTTNSCEVRAGRLMEICIDRGFHSIGDVDEMRGHIVGAFETVSPDVQVVVAADWRRTRLMATEAASAFGQMIGSFNARIERSAAVSSPGSPTAVLQFLRVIRESNHPQRKLFESTSDLVAYLGEVLTPVERERLAVFLSR